MYKNMYRITLFLCALFAFVVFLQGTYSYAATPIVDERSLSHWGYKTIASGEKNQTKWEKSKFGSATIYSQKIKATKEVSDWPNAYYRFTITREEYLSDSKAQKRLKKLYKTPPHINTKMHPEYVLRKGFRKGTCVYIVSTDVLKFEIEELPRIFELLEAYINSNSP